MIRHNTLTNENALHPAGGRKKSRREEKRARSGKAEHPKAKTLLSSVSAASALRGSFAATAVPVAPAMTALSEVEENYAPRVKTALTSHRNALAAPTSGAVTPPLLSALVDALRGMTILILLIAHHISFPIVPEFLTNAGWNEGVHLVDMVFPWFLLAAGIALAIGGTPHYSEKKKWALHMLKSAKSAAVMFILGCIVDSTLAGKVVIGFGILQYIGLASLISNALYDRPAKRRIVIASVLLVGYWLLVRFYPIPGMGSGAFTLELNAIRHLDQHYLDPYNLDGILQLIPATAMVLIGTIVCDYLRHPLRLSRKCLGLALGGSALVGLGMLWNLDIPFNKPVLTSSYILFAAGWGCVSISILFLALSLDKAKKTLFIISILGANALAAYVIPILFRVFLMQGITVHTSSGFLSLKDMLIGALTSHAGFASGNVLYTLLLVGCWWLVFLPLYRKKIFLKP